MARVLQVELKSSLFDPHSSDRKIWVRRMGDRPLYRVFLYLDGRDLHFVESVTYHLHPTFQDPIRMVPRTSSNPICKLELWTWGFFEIQAVVADKTGSRHTLFHQLDYGKEIVQGEVNYVSGEGTANSEPSTR